jgi:hypothetical protein
VTTNKVNLLRWQRQVFEILIELINRDDLPLMTWTVSAFGAAGEPSGSELTNDEKVDAVRRWAKVLGAVHWAPHTDSGMTRIIASVKNYNDTPITIMVKATLYEVE